MKSRGYIRQYRQERRIAFLAKEETGEIVRSVCYNQESAAQVDCIIYGIMCDSGMYDLIYKLYKFNQMVIKDGVPKGEYIEITPEMLNK